MWVEIMQPKKERLLPILGQPAARMFGHSECLVSLEFSQLLFRGFTLVQEVVESPIQTALPGKEWVGYYGGGVISGFAQCL